jgi:BMFP domain-containing protein YqiC
MSKKEFLKEDVLKFLGGTSSILNALMEEIEERIKLRVEKVISKFEIVTKSEFEIVFSMAQESRKENAILKKKLDALEKKMKLLSKNNNKKYFFSKNLLSIINKVWF